MIFGPKDVKHEYPIIFLQHNVKLLPNISLPWVLS
jgi:hypothetical protein